jgi:hypothetical protein
MIFLSPFLITFYTHAVKRSISIVGLTIMFLLSFQMLTAQKKQYFLTNIDISRGLSHNRVQCFLKDRKGILSTGTFEGLNRFNGYSFKVFKNDPDP